MKLSTISRLIGTAILVYLFYPEIWLALIRIWEEIRSFEGIVEEKNSALLLLAIILIGRASALDRYKDEVKGEDEEKN
jgi:hypothetical protein